MVRVVCFLSETRLFGVCAEIYEKRTLIVTVNILRKTVEEQTVKEKRFEKVYTQGAMSGMEIWVDKKTGMHYLYHAGGYDGGLTPLLDSDGKVIVKK